MRTWADQMTDACPQAVATETLSAWRDATLAAPDAAFLARHAPTCRACAERLALFDAIEVALRQQRTPAPRPSLWGEVYARLADEARGGARGGAREDVQQDDVTDDGYPSGYVSAYPGARPTGTASRPGPADSGRLPLGRQRLRRRWGAVGAASAALLIAALLIGLLVSRQGLTGVSGHATPTAHTPVSSVTAAASPSATGAPLPAGWQNLTALDTGPAQPVIAPSNPQVVYFAATSGGAATSKATAGATPTALLARSDDGGVTIHHLPFPTLNGQTIDTYAPTIVYVFVSPLNPHTVYLTAQFSLGACPSNFAPTLMRRVKLDAGSGAQRDGKTLSSAVCQPQYISTDSGQTWRLLSLPTKGLLAVAPVNANRFSNAIQAQGTRLYSTVTDEGLGFGGGVTPGGRLVTSVDGGITWSLVDSPIVAQGLQVYNFAPAPIGSTVFVVSENPQTNQPPTYAIDPHLWRSDDSGATWTELGYTPNGSATTGPLGGMVATVSASGQPILYLDTSSGKIAQSASVEVSVDGGQNWQAAPDAGALSEADPLGVTASGKVVMVFGDGSFRAWTLGDPEWTTVAPALGSSFSRTLYFIGAANATGDGKLALYALGALNSSSSASAVVARYVLA